MNVSSNDKPTKSSIRQSKAVKKNPIEQQESHTTTLPIPIPRQSTLNIVNYPATPLGPEVTTITL